MTNTSKIDYLNIATATAGELIKLSYEELDELIGQAKAIRSGADLALKWLEAIQLEKAIRENADIFEEGGEQ